MSFNLTALVRDLAAARGIPEEHLPAVEHRAIMANRAAESLGRSWRYRFPLRDLARRIVAGAVADHGRGLLERRCA
ncbi:MAG TPA: hypothetical protein VLT47_11000 [Anaeromyxobacteraceae bacterium]|nr:hypothetical protein [Anaeromyxobacteraceae bacterium]